MLMDLLKLLVKNVLDNHDPNLVSAEDYFVSREIMFKNFSVHVAKNNLLLIKPVSFPTTLESVVIHCSRSS